MLNNSSLYLSVTFFTCVFLSGFLVCVVLEGENVTLSALSTGPREHETSRPHVCTTLGLPDD